MTPTTSTEPTLRCIDTLAGVYRHGAPWHRQPAARRNHRVGLALAAVALTLVNCANPSESGRQQAKEMALDTAKRYIRDVEVAAISRSELGDGSVRYLRGRLERSGDQVLGSWSRSGMAEPGPVVGWVDVALTRTSSDSVFAEGATVTICVRFEVSWSERWGAQYSYQSTDCPADMTPR